MNLDIMGGDYTSGKGVVPVLKDHYNLDNTKTCLT